MPNPPYPDRKERDTDKDELDPHTKAAREFAGLVGNLLEQKLGPIRERLLAGDERFARVEQVLRDLTNEVASYREELRALTERLTRLEAQHASRHPRDSMTSVAPGG